MYGDSDQTDADLNQQQNYYEIAIIKAQVAQQRYFRRLRGFLIFILVAGSIYLLDRRPEPISIDKALLALAITWLGLAPSIHYLSNPNRPPIPFFPLVGIFYATSFGLPMFSSHLILPGFWSSINVSDTALTLVMLGIIGMILAFYVSKASLWQKVNPIQLPKPYSRSKLLTLLWLFLLLHIAFFYVPFVKTLPSVDQLLEPFGYVAYGAFYIIWSRGQLPSIQTWLLLGIFVPLELIYRFASGALAQIMLLGLFMALVIWYERKRLPIVSISILLSFFMIFNPVKGEYRSLTWGKGDYYNASPVEKVQLFIDVTVKHYSKFGSESQNQGAIDSSTDSVSSRTAHIILFSKVYDDTPTRVPYWNGATYTNLLTSYIPRALWSEKPTERIGNEFGRRYRYLASNDYVTSLNLPWIVELYANFGTPGVLIGMPLIGLLLALIEQKLNYPRMESLEVVMGATVLLGLIYQESNLSVMIGAVLNLTLALYVLLKFFLRRPG